MTKIVCYNARMKHHDAYTAPNIIAAKAAQKAPLLKCLMYMIVVQRNQEHNSRSIVRERRKDCEIEVGIRVGRVESNRNRE